MEYIRFWIEMAVIALEKLDPSKLDENTKNGLVYAASRLYEELKRAAI